jgi:aspartyl-tRNA(Asn)/glutamyl-tRNA(Gln) amidotransferase subunit A
MSYDICRRAAQDRFDPVRPAKHHTSYVKVDVWSEGGERDVSDPAELGVLDAAALLRARKLSAEELASACFERIERSNGGAPSFDGSPDAVNAWARLYPELALEQARAADARLAREGSEAPLLCGIPLALKDLYGVAGLPVTASSRVLEGHVADVDAVAWARLRDRGMVLLGHTHMHEFAAGGTTDQVGNPRALDRIAGGSSGGSAAALAAHMTPAALGTDTCGSLRLPSACCGTSTIKPTRGRIPLAGILPLAPSMDHAGPMARTIADCAALLHALTADGPDRSPLTPPPAALGELPLAPRPGSRPLAGVRIAVTDRTAQIAMHAEVAEALEAAISACRQLGAEVVARPAPWQFAWDDLDAVQMTEVWVHHREHQQVADRYRPAVAEFVEIARRFTDGQAYVEAQARRAEGASLWEDWFADQDVDLVLEPTMPMVPWERGPGYDAFPEGDSGDPMIAFTVLWSLTGMPAASLPVTWEAGVSLIAPRGREASLAHAAIDLQEHSLGVPGFG